MFTITLCLFSAIYIALILVILRQQKPAANSLQEFFVSGRDVGLGKAIATIGATEIGLITIAYNAQKGFNEGFSSFHIGIAALIGCLLVGLLGLVVKPLHRTKVLTIPEYYERRYGRDIRVFGALIMALGGILNMGLFLKVAALFLVALMGLEQQLVSANLVMVALIVLAVAYTCYGGMRSVITTDIFQFILMSVGLLLALGYVLDQISLTKAIEIIELKKGAPGFDPFINPNFGISYFLWMILVAGVVSAAIWPTALSRALCIKDEKTVGRAYLLSSFIFMGRMIIPAFLGLLAFCYFNLPDAGERGVQLTAYGDDGDLVATALMLREMLPDWFLAFMAVAFFASFMSTQDGYLFCWASIISRDILGPLTGRIEDPAFQKRATRISIILIALYELYWGLIYQGKEDIWDYLAVSGSIYFCSAIVLLIGGLYWKRASRRGALWALILGFSSLTALSPVKTTLGLEAFSAPIIGFASIGLALAGFIFGSLIDQRSRPKTALGV